jgi:uncharacterized protein YjbJ (UPF0337 family)
LELCSPTNRHGPLFGPESLHRPGWREKIRAQHPARTPARLPAPNATHLKDTNMNWDRIEGNWKQFKGNAKEQWGKLTDDQIDVIAGKRDVLAGKIQDAYGLSREVVESQLADWQKRMKELNRNP